RRVRRQQDLLELARLLLRPVERCLGVEEGRRFGLPDRVGPGREAPPDVDRPHRLANTLGWLIHVPDAVEGVTDGGPEPGHRGAPSLLDRARCAEVDSAPEGAHDAPRIGLLRIPSRERRHERLHAPAILVVAEADPSDGLLYPLRLVATERCGKQAYKRGAR